MNENYKRAYTEVLEILKYFPDEEYSKIPVNKISFYKNNMDVNYNFHIDPNIDLEKQNISKEANAILIALFKEYFANDRQKKILNNLLNQNQQKLEKIKYEKYNLNEIFKQDETIKTNHILENNNKKGLIEYKKKFFTRFINLIKSIFRR